MFILQLEHRSEVISISSARSALGKALSAYVVLSWWMYGGYPNFHEDEDPLPSGLPNFRLLQMMDLRRDSKFGQRAQAKSSSISI